VRVVESERRHVLEVLNSIGARSMMSGRYIGSIQQHTARQTASGRGGQYGVQRVRTCLNEAIADGHVKRYRSWGSEYTYWLTDEGIAWLTQ
jgi:hypothetical protein